MNALEIHPSGGREAGALTPGLPWGVCGDCSLGNEKGRDFSSIQQELRQAVGSGLMTVGYQCGGRCSEDGRRTFRCVAVRVHGDNRPLTCEGTSPVHLASPLGTCWPAPSPSGVPAPSSALGRAFCPLVSSIPRLEFPCLPSLPSSSRMQDPSFLLPLLSLCALQGAEAQWGLVR